MDSERNQNNQVPPKKKKRSKLQKLLADPFGLMGFVLILLIVCTAVFAPFIAPYDPTEINVRRVLEGPSRDHLLGTDNLGRDTLSRIIYGSRIALSIGLLATVVSVILGVVFGVIAGYFASWVDFVFVNFFDIIRAIPPLLLAIAIIVLVGAPSIMTLILVLGLTTFPRYARLIRAQTFSVKEYEYVMAAKVSGASSLRIMARHIIPNVIGPLFITAAMGIPAIISFEAGLSFLGLGVPPPTPSWGAILRIGFNHIRSAPWMVIFGGLALIFATLGFTLLAEALRDVFDPKLRGSEN